MEQRAAMTWARRSKVISIDINECEKCKGRVKIIACIEDPARRITDPIKSPWLAPRALFS